MPKVVGLRGRSIPAGDKPNAEVIDILETYLAQARDGHVRGVAFAMFTADDAMITGWSGDFDNRKLLSAAALLSYRLAKQLDEQ